MKSLRPSFQYHAAKGATGTLERPWCTGVWRRAPVFGLLALIIALLCGLATIVVLKTSDNIPINEWRVHGYNVQPTVILSVLATLANALFRYAFSEGARDSWWVRAQDGTSIGSLHRAWEHAQSILSILTAGRQLTLTGISGLFTLLLLIDGPLLQRATTIGETTKQISTNLSVPISPSPFTIGATGILTDHGTVPTLYNPLFGRLLQNYNTRQPITLPELGCKGKCELTIEAPGFDIDCESWNSPYQLESISNYNGTFTNRTANALTQTMFSVNVTYSSDANKLWYKLRSYRTGAKIPTDDETLSDGALPWNTIMLSSMIKSTPGGDGNLTWRTCILREALQRYPIVVENATVTLQPLSLQQNHTVYQVLRYGPEGGLMQDQPSTIGGMWLAVYHEFAGKAELRDTGPWSAIQTHDSSPLVYLNPKTSAGGFDSYNVTWMDPIDDMISMIRELSLRTAIATTTEAPPPADSILPAKELAQQLTAAQTTVFYPNLTQTNRTLSQHAQAVMTYDETVYKSNFSWLGGALAIIIVTFGSILPIFNRWWHLGRPFTMSPIEIAKAFDAPPLRQADDNCRAAELIDEIGEQRVRYGAAEYGQMDCTFLEPRSQKGGSSVQVEEVTYSKRKLQFGRDGMVDEPFEGETFAGSREDVSVLHRLPDHGHDG